MRAADPSDAPRLLQILAEAYAPYLDLLGPDAPPLSQDIPRDIADGACLVAGDPPAGFAVFRILGDTLHLENIAAAPAAQGSGCGRALIEAVEARGRASDCKAVRLATSPLLEKTRTFYARLGYRETGQDERRIFLEKPL